jgi:hypothetical protein
MSRIYATTRDLRRIPPDVAPSALEHAVTCLPDLVEGIGELPAPLVAMNPNDLPTDVEGRRGRGRPSSCRGPATGRCWRIPRSSTASSRM